MENGVTCRVYICITARDDALAVSTLTYCDLGYFCYLAVVLWALPEVVGVAPMKKPCLEVPPLKVEVPQYW